MNRNIDFDLLTIREVAKMLKVDRSAIYRYFKKGLTPIKLGGGAVRVAKEDLNEFILKGKLYK